MVQIKAKYYHCRLVLVGVAIFPLWEVEKEKSVVSLETWDNTPKLFAFQKAGTYLGFHGSIPKAILRGQGWLLLLLTPYNPSLPGTLIWSKCAAVPFSCHLKTMTVTRGTGCNGGMHWIALFLMCGYCWCPCRDEMLTFMDKWAMGYAQNAVHGLCAGPVFVSEWHYRTRASRGKAKFLICFSFKWPCSSARESSTMWKQKDLHQIVLVSFQRNTYLESVIAVLLCWQIPILLVARTHNSFR